jgi:hypothetical protein
MDDTNHKKPKCRRDPPKSARGEREMEKRGTKQERPRESPII